MPELYNVLPLAICLALHLVMGCIIFATYIGHRGWRLLSAPWYALRGSSLHKRLARNSSSSSSQFDFRQHMMNKSPILYVLLHACLIFAVERILLDIGFVAGFASLPDGVKSLDLDPRFVSLNCVFAVFYFLGFAMYATVLSIVAVMWLQIAKTLLQDDLKQQHSNALYNLIISVLVLFNAFGYLGMVIPGSTLLCAPWPTIDPTAKFFAAEGTTTAVELSVMAIVTLIITISGIILMTKINKYTKQLSTQQQRQNNQFRQRKAMVQKLFLSLLVFDIMFALLMLGHALVFAQVPDGIYILVQSGIPDCIAMSVLMLVISPFSVGCRFLQKSRSSATRTIESTSSESQIKLEQELKELRERHMSMARFNRLREAQAEAQATSPRSPLTPGRSFVIPITPSSPNDDDDTMTMATTPTSPSSKNNLDSIFDVQLAEAATSASLEEGTAMATSPPTPASDTPMMLSQDT